MAKVAKSQGIDSEELIESIGDTTNEIVVELNSQPDIEVVVSPTPSPRYIDFTKTHSTSRLFV